LGAFLSLISGDTGHLWYHATMPYQLIALDVDGTLLDSAHHLRPRVIAVVRAASAAGFAITLATGKLLPSIEPLLEALGIGGPQITLNGAATITRETRDVLRFCPLAEERRREVLTTVRAADPDVLISHFTQDTIYMDRAHPLIGIFAEYGEGPPVLVPDLLASDLPPAAKILLSGPPARLARLRALVTPRFAGRISVTTTTPDFLEFFALDAGKGLALAALRAELGLPRASVIAIGDGENDLPLLREAGLGVAMANGAEVTRAAAHYVTASHDEDGVAVFLERLLRGDFPLPAI
jgi:Cof subfamily protein (haloacid dehalogenase superfamily)